MKCWRVFVPLVTATTLGPLCMCAQNLPTNQRETLKQYVSDLQKNPTDDSLREKIIEMTLTLNPRPVTPPEVDDIVGRAKYAIQHATSSTDFLDAAHFFERASLMAPWMSDYYFNQGVAYEKAQEFNSAIKAFEWYLRAAPDAQDAKAVRERIGGLKFAQEKIVTEQMRKSAAEETDEAKRKHDSGEDDPFIKRLNGANFHWHDSNKFWTWDQYITIRGRDAFFENHTTPQPGNNFPGGDVKRRQGSILQRQIIVPKGTYCSGGTRNGECDQVCTIREDGNEIDCQWVGAAGATGRDVYRRSD